MKNRLKNYGLWVSFIALVPMLAQALGDYNIFVKLPGNYDQLAMAILGIVVLLGLVNDPTTNNKGFKDDE